MAINSFLAEGQKLHPRMGIKKNGWNCCVCASPGAGAAVIAGAGVNGEVRRDNLGFRARTLLMNIIGFSELLLLKLSESEKRELLDYVAHIRDAGLKLEQLIEEVTCVRRDNLGPCGAVVPVAEIVARCREAVAARATAAGVSLKTEVAPEVAPALVGDLLLLEVLTGLLLLSVGKTPKGGRVGLWCTRLEDKVLFTVWRSFTPGWQMAECSGPSGDETAAGERVFALVRELCKAQGGAFWMEGTLGEMASFCLLLPPAAEGEAPAAAPNVSHPKEA
ncbi:hypothetical protein EDD75_2181 [Thermodesulfitimonas autotrophica]|uniref:Uncharacterized protein n=1 Tax=Thermodesulfitimonas autotrophica TaxID=1894989 RepID=A0A3N5B2X5_9THEO|nr:hypothetical protein [Thermodesulfitimonas autotrophica]RPF43062.1 hypothetical protein EDD75_2181 [Thermodesulfitimonas autotrophica]